MKNIWITGISGFIGGHLARYAYDEDFQISGLDIFRFIEPDAQKPIVKNFIEGGISVDNLNQLREKGGLPDTIIHLAGGSSVGYSIEHPFEDFERSVNTSMVLLEWVRTHVPQSNLVLVSSAAVYGDRFEHPIAESEECKPFSPYGYHKRASELLFESYAKNYHIKTAIIRLFSVYGQGLRKQLLWDVCTKLKKDPDTIELFGTGNEQRDWLHVSDAARFILKTAAFASDQCVIFNGGRGIGVPIREIVAHLVDAWRSGAAVQFNNISRAGDPGYLVADVQKQRESGLIAAIDWKPGIAQYIEWYKGTECKSIK